VNRVPEILHVQLCSRRQCIAMEVRRCGYLHIIDTLQSGRFLSLQIQLTVVYTPLHYQII